MNAKINNILPILFFTCRLSRSFSLFSLPFSVFNRCAKTAITITVLTPAMGQLLTADATTQVPSLRHAFFVGDVLAKRDVLRLQALAVIDYAHLKHQARQSTHTRYLVFLPFSALHVR